MNVAKKTMDGNRRNTLNMFDTDTALDTVNMLDKTLYKMWGNGVALTCVAFVLFGIAYAHDIY